MKKGDRMIVIYHNDFDGIASAAIINNTYLSSNIKFIEGNYSEEFNFDEIKTKDNEKLFIVDYSLTSEEQWESAIKNFDVTWIDHHETSIARWKNFKHLSGVRNTDYSAVLLTYQFFHPNESVPEIIKYLNDYDIWQWKYGETTRYIQEGLKCRETHPNEILWYDLIAKNDQELLQEIINEGKLISEYIDRQNEKIIANNAYEIRWYGYNCICCNSNIRNSLIFKALQKEYDIYIVFEMNREQKYIVSLYSTNPNIKVNEIAVLYNGGGHPGAAGFTTNKLPWINPHH